MSHSATMLAPAAATRRMLLSPLPMQPIAATFSFDAADCVAGAGAGAVSAPKTDRAAIAVAAIDAVDCRKLRRVVVLDIEFSLEWTWSLQVTTPSSVF